MRAAIQRWMDRHALNRFVLCYRLVRTLGLRHLPFIAAVLPRSRAQLLQDLFVLIELDRKRDGYFVEIGVGDGRYLSNTWLLEKGYGWRGLLAEPNRSFAGRIRATRTAALETRAVWHTSGERLQFLEVSGIPELSTLRDFRQADVYPREGCATEVTTISLNDLLAQHGAPAQIDYLSLDTEGSEWEILEGLDFGKYRFGVLTIEHNHDAERLARITGLLARHGYARVHAGFTRFDAWFVSDASLAAASAAAHRQPTAAVPRP